MNIKLIIVEGLPGFGKSTTAKLINEILCENNQEVELFLEGNLNHPADYDGVACFSKMEFERLLSNSGVLKDVFLERTIQKGNNFLLPYLKMKNELGVQIPEEVMNIIFKNDIYELPFEQNMELIVQKWEEFAHQAAQTNKTYIFECCFIQNPLTIGMIKHGVKQEESIEYVMKLKKTIEVLNPVLFYIEQDNLEYSFQRAVNERPKEWSEGFVDYYTTQGYGKQHRYEGIEGTIRVLQARKELELKIFDDLDIKKVRMNNSNYDVSHHKSKIIENLKDFSFMG
jgi:DNA polymerase III delta prime subunit